MKTKIFYLLTFVNIICFSIYLFSFTTMNNDNSNNVDFQDKILKVRGLVVVDSLGIERVIVGSHLPEPNFSQGNRVAARKKNGSVSGVMLYDHEGQERGGYVTDDNFGNAFLTLDSKVSQHFLLLCGPDGGAYINMWDRNNNSIKLGTNEYDSYIDANKNGKKINLLNDEK